MYEIAYNLRMPVYRLLSEMPFEEYQEWIMYFEARPAGWQDDDRTVKLLQAQGVKEKPWDIFKSLRAVYGKNVEPPKNEDGLMVGGDIKSSLLFQKLLGAKGGDLVT